MGIFLVVRISDGQLNRYELDKKMEMAASAAEDLYGVIRVHEAVFKDDIDSTLEFHSKLSNQREDGTN